MKKIVWVLLCGLLLGGCCSPKPEGPVYPSFKESFAYQAEVQTRRLDDPAHEVGAFEVEVAIWEGFADQKKSGLEWWKKRQWTPRITLSTSTPMEKPGVCRSTLKSGTIISEYVFWTDEEDPSILHVNMYEVKPVPNQDVEDAVPYGTGDFTVEIGGPPVRQELHMLEEARPPVELVQ